MCSDLAGRGYYLVSAACSLPPFSKKITASSVQRRCRAWPRVTERCWNCVWSHRPRWGNMIRTCGGVAAHHKGLSMSGWWHLSTPSLTWENERKGELMSWHSRRPLWDSDNRSVFSNCLRGRETFWRKDSRTTPVSPVNTAYRCKYPRDHVLSQLLKWFYPIEMHKS